MGERVRHMLVKEFIQIFRDPRMRAIVFITPILQLVLLGYAVTTDVRAVPTAVLDLDRSGDSRELVRRFEASGYFRVTRHVPDPRAVQDLLDRGAVKAAIQLDPGFATDLRRGRATVQILVDGTDSNTAGVVSDHASRILAAFGREVGGEVRPAGSGAVPPRGPGLDLRTRAWYNPDLRSQSFYVPGVIAILLMLTSLLLTSMAIVREREIGTMEQLLVTPIRPVELILGKTIPFGVIGFVDLALISVVAVFWFEVPIRGSLLVLVLATGLYLLSALGIGLLISTVSRTQQQALMTTFFFFQPAMLLSGFVFPIANMPRVIQYLTYANPLRYFLVVIRGLFLKGSGLAILWPEMLALAGLGAVLLTVSTLRFRKRLE
jgi:ABC-2 type transport system permease protein